MNAKNVFLIATTLFVLGYSSFGEVYTDTLSPYLQLEKAGSLFTIRVSTDGITCTEISSIDRTDMWGTVCGGRACFSV